jgi:hypothetical protein
MNESEIKDYISGISDAGFDCFIIEGAHKLDNHTYNTFYIKYAHQFGMDIGFEMEKLPQMTKIYTQKPVYLDENNSKVELETTNDVWGQDLWDNETVDQLSNALKNFLENQQEIGYQFDLMWTGEANLPDIFILNENIKVAFYSQQAFDDYKKFTGRSSWPSDCIFNTGMSIDTPFPHDNGINDEWFIWYQSGLTDFITNVANLAKDFNLKTLLGAHFGHWAGGQNHTEIAKIKSVDYYTGHIHFPHHSLSFKVHDATLGTKTTYVASADIGDDNKLRPFGQMNSLCLNALAQSNHVLFWRPHIINKKYF